MPHSILIIKHSALGDIVLATACFKAIRAHHPEAEIVLLTTAPYAELLAQSPYFNEIWVDRRPRWTDRTGIRRLKAMLNSRRWAWVYDLQTSDRSTGYQWLLRRPWPKISNKSRWTSHGIRIPDALEIPALERLRRQLALAGITEIGLPDLSWMGSAEGEALAASLPSPYALLVPGGAAHRPEKRWPADHFAALAQELLARGVTPVLIGTEAEREALDRIAARVPASIHLGGKTKLPMLASLARQAALAIGNDTGPMHILAASGCPSLVLFGPASSPIRSAPIGPAVRTLASADLSALAVDTALAAALQVG